MTTFPFNAVGFDLDGTLVDSFRDLGEAVNHALELGGFEKVPVDSSKDLIGGGAKIMLSKAVDAQSGKEGGLSADEFKALYKKMLAYYSENNAVHTRPYPHAREVVGELKSRGVKVIVVTNKFEEFARSILTQIDFIEPFEAVIGGNSLGKGPDGQFLAKPHPDPIFKAREICGGGSFAFVGDSTYDVNAAKSAGVPVVGAAYGYCDKPPHELGADAVIDSLDGLIPALETL
ncbi:HAD hydrolase-like protein [Qipengyuania sp. S6317L1]|uniref:HAD hydrolase-like protein n=1 Tax=Qipengyuania sp. S6317L1 TaxID=2926410 RepID=UPI001FF5990E|nr:HAD hydrolase-like protein [Qipengyuania sp. S6317L1]MCK0098127.1 HAD hydrolase-like protein [Qipengyuania sp. S6317L1]